MKKFKLPDKMLNPHEPFLGGANKSYMALGYFPVDELEKILPNGMSVPSDEIMARKYPTAKKIDGMHPFMLMFSKCFNVHDFMTNIDLRPYQELMFYFPVVYSQGKEERLCSYVPVLYLDFFLGVIGGLYLGLRKQFHPKMKVQETGASRAYHMKGILDVDFQQAATDDSRELDPFFLEIFENPTATVSYFNRTCFYTALLHPDRVLDASPTYQWSYKGSVISNDQNTFGNYCEYDFTISQAMPYEKYFHPSTVSVG